MVRQRFFQVTAACCLFITRVGGAEPSREARGWTNADGRKIEASYLGMKGDSAVLKLTNGTIAEVPAARLSADDQRFLKTNAFPYRAAWQAWDPRSRQPLRMPEVEEDVSGSETGTFAYTTSHFRFVSDVNLGKPLMKDLATVFELTYQLQSLSPLGTLAEPVDGKLFQAKFFGTLDAYKAAGGPVSTAGVYLLKEKVFLAPLDLMGVKKGSAGWRRDLATYDLTTIIHELTHMLTHGMLNNLPVWVNEGYAEYIARIPIVRGAFTTSADDIRNGVIDALISDVDRMAGVPKPRTGVLSKRDRIAFRKETVKIDLFHPARVLQMTDAKWAGPQPGFTSGSRENRLPRLYRTAHLILYYFIQIEGESGVLKLRRFLEENQKRMSAYNQYLDDFNAYQIKMETFLKLPGVQQLDDGRIRFPSNLTPPTAPDAPFKDPDSLKLGGIDALLAGETAETLGARIEAALIKDLGLALKFVDTDSLDHDSPRIPSGTRINR